MRKHTDLAMVWTSVEVPDPGLAGCLIFSHRIYLSTLTILRWLSNRLSGSSVGLVCRAPLTPLGKVMAARAGILRANSAAENDARAHQQRHERIVPENAENAQGGAKSRVKWDKQCSIQTGIKG